MGVTWHHWSDDVEKTSCGLAIYGPVTLTRVWGAVTCDACIMQRPEPPYHRWPSNEDADKHPMSDRCLACRVKRWDEHSDAANLPCPGKVA
jgi:hypothetical protein